ncbi:DNA polymerase III subunit delta' [Candidatus Falkowbacteria bacterium]|nr:DNA polymerase III subunit delta' [Candidatus Falkowbacteria bacterium]
MEVGFNWPIIGHAKIISFLQKSIVNNKLAHAYLFTGPRLSGKTTIAKYFANSIICDQRRSIEFKKENIVLPCGECPRCREWKRNIYPDVYWLEREAKKEGEKVADLISVGQARILIDKISKRAFSDSYKIIIIPNAEALGAEASNALLKTIEEPGEKTVIILIAPHKDSVLATIYSRCQEIRFFPTQNTEIYKGLLNSGAQRSIANELSRVSQGLPTLAVQLSHNVEYYERYKEEIKKALNFIDADQLGQLQFSGAMAEKFGNDKNGWKIFLDNLTNVLRDLLLFKIGQDQLTTNVFAEEEFKKIADKKTVEQLSKTILAVFDLKKLLSTNANLKMSIESAMLGI